MPIYEIDFRGLLYPLQYDIFNDPARFKVVCCGRRWGKTKMCALIAVQKALQGKRVWWVTQTYEGTDLGFREIEALFKQIPMRLIIKHSKPKSIILPNGGSISFKSTKHSDYSRGEGLDYLIVDEADFIDVQPENSGKVWHELLRPTLVDRKGEAILITTPNIEGGWINKLWLKGNAGDPQYKSWSYSSYTNPYLDHKEIDDVKIDTPSITFRREYLAEWVSSAGARIQRAWLIDHYIDLPDTPEARRKWLDSLYISMGVDLAVSEKKTADYVAYAVIGRDASGKVFILDVQRMRGSFESQIEHIRRGMDQWNPNTVGIESVGYQDVMIQTLSKATSYAIFPVKVNKDKITRFAPLEARYERKEVWHLRGLPPEFENELFGFPNAEHDDQIDAMSCAWAVLGTPIAAGDEISGIFASSTMNDEEITLLDEVMQSEYGSMKEVLDGY
jgi:predicted phage terminase large subunit-like protein